MLSLFKKKPVTEEFVNNNNVGFAPECVFASLQSLINLKHQSKQVNIRRSKNSRANLAGQHASSFRGRGMDYQESRQYQAGDDIRSMDWRVTARTGKPHTKLYQEERERPVVFVIDYSPTLFFGTKQVYKSVIASKIATLLAWSVSQSGDKVGALISNKAQQRHIELPPKGSNKGVLSMIRGILKASKPLALAEQNAPFSKSENDFSFNAQLKRTSRLNRYGNLIVLVGDFFDLDEQSLSHLKKLKQHNDVLAIKVTDDFEQSLPPADFYSVKNNQKETWLDLKSKKGRENISTYFADKQNFTADVFQKTQIPFYTVSTSDNIPEKLAMLFPKKAKVNNGRRKK